MNLDSRLGRCHRGQRRSRAASRSSTTTASPSGAAPTTTCPSTTCKVGKLQGAGLVNCLERRGRRKPRRRRAQRLAHRQQRHAVQAGLRLGAQADVPAGTTTRSPINPCPTGTTRRRCTIFEQMCTKANDKIDGTLAANDGLGNAAIAVAEEEQAQRQGPGDGAGRDGPGPPEHPCRRPVHDRLQGRQEGGRRGRRRWPSRSPRAARARRPQRSTTPTNGKKVAAVLLNRRRSLRQRQGRHRRRLHHDGRGLHADYADQVHGGGIIVTQRSGAPPSARRPTTAREEPQDGESVS